MPILLTTTIDVRYQRNRKEPPVSQPTQPSGENASRSENIREVVNQCIAQRAAGETVTDESLIAAHPELMPELAEALKNLRLVQQAQLQAEFVNVAHFVLLRIMFDIQQVDILLY